MRKIIVYQKGVSNVEILDDSTQPIDEYSKELSTIFQMKNVAILKTSSSTIVLRPSQIASIEVQEIDDQIEEEKIVLTSDNDETVEETVKQIEKIEEDIITDMD